MRRFFARLVRLIRRRNDVLRLTGIYMSRGFIRPHHTVFELVPVSRRVVRRLDLALGDRVEFDISARSGEARRVRCYKKFFDAPPSDGRIGTW